MVKTPFYIIHLDILLPVKIYNGSVKPISLLTIMFDLTKNVISSLLDQLKFQSVVTAFMEIIIMSFGIHAAIVINAYSKFRGVFKESLRELNSNV